MPLCCIGYYDLHLKSIPKVIGLEFECGRSFTSLQAPQISHRMPHIQIKKAFHLRWWAGEPQDAVFWVRPLSTQRMLNAIMSPMSAYATVASAECAAKTIDSQMGGATRHRESNAGSDVDVPRTRMQVADKPNKNDESLKSRHQ